MTLCRRSDVGKPKAVVAADFINRRVAGSNVTAYLLHRFLAIFLSWLLLASYHITPAFMYKFKFQFSLNYIHLLASCYRSVVILDGVVA